MQQSVEQRAYTAVVEYFIATGRAPHYTELAEILGLQPEQARLAQHGAADAAIACWFMNETDYIESWAPFSNIPTQYLISVQGQQKWYGQ